MVSVYNKKYDKLREQGFLGWGGDERISKLGEQFAYITKRGFVPESGSVLELGCGEGTLSRLFANNGYKVTGVDISSSAIEWAKSKQSRKSQKINYHCVDLGKDTIDFEDFDLVVDGNCFHCIQKPERELFLENITRSLKENGILFISSMCVKKNDCSRVIHDNGFAYRYLASQDEIVEEVELHGYTVLEFEIFNREEHDHIKLFARK